MSNPRTQKITKTKWKRGKDGTWHLEGTHMIVDSGLSLPAMHAEMTTCEMTHFGVI